MLMRDYFLLGLNNGMGKKLYWMNSLFFELLNAKVTGYELEPIFEDNKMFFSYKGEKVQIEDYVPNRAPLHFRDKFVLKPGDMENYTGKTEAITTYGNVYCNHLCLVLPFGSLFEFKFGLFKPQQYENEIMDLVIDDPDDLDEDSPYKAEGGKVYVWQYLLFCDHALSMTSFADGLITTTTAKSMVGSSKRDAVRGKWLKDNKARLTDPAAVAELSDLMKALDDEHLAGDASLGYFESEKKLVGARRKSYYFFGGESPFGDGSKVDLIPRSLEEGYDVEKIPTMNSAARAGSYDRGTQTALGGSATKTMYRMAGTIKIVTDDCGSTVGVPCTVAKDNAEDLVGYSQIINGVSSKITKDTINTLIGKTITLRSPVTCKAEAKNICKVCAGDKLAINPAGIPAAVASMGGVLMLIFMKGMHTNDINTKRWNPDKYLN